jgi:malate synthase
MDKILESLKKALKLNNKLTNYLLKLFKKLVKKAKYIRQQLHNSKEFIKDYKAKKIKVTHYLKKL